MTAGSDKFERLPTFAKPENYRIHLEPDLENFTANGRVDILINFVEATDFVKLHFGCRELKSAKLTLDNGKEWNELKFEVDKKWKTVVVNFPEKLQPQKTTLTIDFDGEINSGLHGFYRSVFKDSDGNKQVMAATQFESEAARLAFPSFDEPMFKATFDIELLVDEKLTALSNMNVIGEDKVNGKKLVKFATTPIMSTYLIAFVIGNLEFIETKYGNGIPVRVYTTRGRSHQAHFALDLAKKAMEYLESWFDFPSPLPKIDLVGIPDFGMGAMENWGLVTFREIYVCTTEQTTHAIKARTALIIFHELAHFYFGNMITMKWWSDLWLKEGFATFCQYVFFDNVQPEFKVMLDFVSDVTSGGQKADEIKSSHSIEVHVNEPCDLESYYDAITYFKSSAVIYMLYKYLGEDTFRDGLRRYIKKFAYSNAETLDLWSALSDASGQKINEIMDTWTKQMGFPLVTVEEEKLGGNKRRLKLKQSRYLADGSTDDQLWQIPLTFVKSSGGGKPFHKFLLTQREQVIELDGIGDDEWVKLNSATSGFYRVQYSDDMLDRLLKAISKNELEVKDRFGLASDLVALVESGKVPAYQFFAFLSALTNENEYIVWRSVESGISTFSNLLDRHNPELKSKLSKFVIQILEPVSKRLGWEFSKGEDPHSSMLRGLVLNSLFKSGHQETIKKALGLFEEYVGGNTDVVHPELRLMVFNVGAQKHPKALEHLLAIHENSGSSEIERDSLVALSRLADEGERKKAFDDGILAEKIRAQDITILFMGSTLGASNQDFSWAWFKNNYVKLVGRFGNPSSLRCTDCFKLVASAQSSDEFAKELEEFYESLNEDIKKAWTIRYKQALERIQLNAQLYRNQHESVAEFLNSN